MAQESSELLQKMKRESEEREAMRKASVSGLTYFDATKTPVQAESLKLVDEKKARRIQVAPFQLKAKNLAIAVFNPSEKSTKEFLKALEGEGYQLKIYIASLSSLEQVWQNFKFVSKPSGAITGKVTIEKERFGELYKKL
ncbi:MAG: hypothetical protein AAB885_02655, partial [Patescibacteria group bacterium]